MPKPRPIDVRIQETRDKLERLQDTKRLQQLQAKIASKRTKRRRRRL